jgi:hypothetical protein
VTEGDSCLRGPAQDQSGSRVLANGVEDSSGGGTTRAYAEVERLKESIAENDCRIAVMAKAAHAWTAASGEAKKLKQDILSQQENVESKCRRMYVEGAVQKVVHEQVCRIWEAEKADLNASILTLNREMERVVTELNLERKLRECEAKGYMGRISELQKWGNSRWGVISADYVIV